MGLGDDYNEDLMQKMGEDGDGNYYFIETSAQLADIFHTELKGLMANLGTKVSLGLEPQAGTTVTEVLNEMDRGPLGRLMLPNLIVGMPIQVVLRVSVPALPHPTELIKFRLAWDDPKTGERRTHYASLTMPVVTRAEWDAMAADEAVAEQVAFQMAAKAKKEAIAHFDAGDECATRAYLGGARLLLRAHESPEARKEIAELDEIAAHLDQGEGAVFRKKTMWQAFRKKRGNE